MAPGSANPIEQKPFGIRQVLGSSHLVVAGDPHLVSADVGQQNIVRAESLAGIPEYFLRANQAFGTIICVGLKLRLHRRANAGLSGKIQFQLPVQLQSLIEHPQGVGEIANHLDIRVVVFVNLRRQKIRVDNLLALERVPQPWVVFDHIEAERDHQVGLIDHQGGQVLGAQPDG